MQMNKTKLIISFAALASIFVAIGVNGVLSAQQQRMPPPPAPVQAPIVSVTQTQPMTKSASVVAYGEVVSRNVLTLTSQVSGQVIYLSPKFLSGKQFNQGEVLARIEPVVYQQALASAKAELAEAKLALAQEQLNSEQAAQEWQQSGLADESASELVLRKPQLQAAEAAFEMAQKSLEKAEYDLKQTEIVAPFDAVVISRDVHLGSNLQAGSTIAQLNDISVFEVALPLSATQWQLLPNDYLSGSSNVNVELIDQTNSQRWHAIVDRSENHINSETRQRSLVVAVESPLAQQTPLYPGSFVKAELTGSAIDGLWQLPASSLVDTGRVWQVTEENVLAYLEVESKFVSGSYIYVKPVNNVKQANIVNRPLSSYLENMKVQIKVEG